MTSDQHFTVANLFLIAEPSVCGNILENYELQNFALL